MKALAFVLAAALFALPAVAQTVPPSYGPTLHKIGQACPGAGALCQPIPAPAPYVGPGDVTATWFFWGGLRAFSNATTGTKSAQLCLRSTPATCQDISTLANGNFDTASAATFCASPCDVATLYDKSGNGRDLTQATAGERPQYTTSALGTLPCMTFVAGTPGTVAGRFLIGSPLAAAAVPFSHSMVVKITANDTSNPTVFGDVGTGTTKQEVVYNGSTTTFLIQDNNTGGFSATTGAAAFHALNAVSNGASSNIAIDGTTTTGTNGTAGIQTADLLAIGDANALNRDLIGIVCEAGMTNTAFSSGTTTSMNSNQHTYWGF